MIKSRYYKENVEIIIDRQTGRQTGTVTAHAISSPPPPSRQQCQWPPLHHICKKEKISLFSFVRIKNSRGERPLLRGSRAPSSKEEAFAKNFHKIYFDSDDDARSTSITLSIAARTIVSVQYYIVISFLFNSNVDDKT